VLGRIVCLEPHFGRLLILDELVDMIMHLSENLESLTASSLFALAELSLHLKVCRVGMWILWTILHVKHRHVMPIMIEFLVNASGRIDLSRIDR
jgi:hypothetical protein